MKNRFLAVAFAFFFLLGPCSGFALANDDGVSIKMDDASDSDSPDQTLLTTVNALLSAIKTPSSPLPGAVLDTLAQETLSQTQETRELPDLLDCNGVVLREAIHAPLSRILEYAYNPNIPSYLMLPSVVRLSGWYPKSQILHLAKPLYQQLPAPQEPLVLHGKEFEEITPDMFTGGYYRYDSKRLLALFRYKGKNVFVSVAQQDGPSGVGRKGVILDDTKWQYLYSGVEGLTKGGIGWMSTYMYNAVSVSVYVDNDDGTTTNTVYKWLRAGWAGMNVVKHKHIIKGCRRYVKAFREVIESPNLPSVQELANKAKEVEALSSVELNKRICLYAKHVERLVDTHSDDVPSRFCDLVKNGGYAKVLDTHQERVSALLLEYLKHQLKTTDLRQG